MENLLNALVLMTNFVIVPSLTYGSQLALGAMGATLVYGVLRFSNFAHGETMALGAMFTILITWGFSHLGIGLGVLPTALLALPFAIIINIMLLLVSDRWVYRYYRQKRSAPVILMIASLGVMFFYHGLVRFIIGPDNRQFADGERFIFKAREMKESLGLLEGFSLKYTQSITIICAIVITVILFWFLNKTRTGKAMRAFSDNEDLALLSGINPEKVVKITWLIVAILACMAGSLYGLDKGFKPFVYLQLLLPIFASAIVGGLGNPMGAIAGAFVVAYSEIGLTYAYKKFFAYLLPDFMMPSGLMQILSTDYKYAVSFIILVLVLIFMPQGIFKGKAL